MRVRELPGVLLRPRGMRARTKAGTGAAVAATVAVALLALWSPTAAAGNDGEPAAPEPALVPASSSGGVDQGSVPPAPPSDGPVAGPRAGAPSSRGSAPALPAVEEPVPASRPPASRAPAQDPDTAVSSPVLPYDPGYWTPERMASAKPMPMPMPSPR